MGMVSRYPVSKVMAGFDAANSQLSRAKRVVDATLGSLDEMILKPLVAVSMTVESTTTSAMAPLSAARGSLESALEALAAIDLAMPDAAALKAPIATARAKLDDMIAKTQARAAPFPPPPWRPLCRGFAAPPAPPSCRPSHCRGRRRRSTR